MKAALLLVLSTAVALAGADWTVGKLTRSPRAKAAAEHGVEFDARDRLAVVEDLRDAGQEAFPTVPPNLFINDHLEVGGTGVAPLSGVAGVLTVGCNESGEYNRFRSDERGFRNPAGIWGTGAGIQMVFVGDSFTQGDCVPDGHTLVDHVRRRYPRTLNLGSGGSGPLLQLATLAEHAAAVSYQCAVWVYFEHNDLKELEREKQDPLLRRYLDGAFTQGLRRLQKPLDDALRGYVERRLETSRPALPWLLPHMRHLVWRLRNRSGPAGAEAAPVARAFDLALLRRILSAARRVAESSGRGLVFVYLPEYERFSDEPPSPATSGASARDEVLALVRDLGIEHLDLLPAFTAVDDPLAFYPFRMPGHFNEAGYAFAGGAIRRFLEEEARCARAGSARIPGRSGVEPRLRVKRSGALEGSPASGLLQRAGQPVRGSVGAYRPGAG